MQNDSDKIRITHSIIPVRIDALKTRLSELIPHVQASHRVEALARGLQFRTWASLIAWRKTANIDERRSVDADAFAEYLADHGFDVPPIALDCAMSLTQPGRGGLIPARDEALFRMGQDTWDAWGSGNRDYEDKVNAQIRFIQQSWEASTSRLSSPSRISPSSP
ncbi:hypothetical protein HFN89_01775 [Rhizobium laguerreae]|nr:hypothetical protein [Rhizobium laguerreae]